MPKTTKPDAATLAAWIKSILKDVASGHTKLDRQHAKDAYDALAAGTIEIVAG